MDSLQREGTRAWHAHIGLEQSNVARVERADLLVFLVVFVVDDRPPGHVLLPAGVGSSRARPRRRRLSREAERPLLATPEHGGPRPAAPSPIRALGTALPS